jgi:hypothetical protein
MGPPVHPKDIVAEMRRGWRDESLQEQNSSKLKVESSKVPPYPPVFSVRIGEATEKKRDERAGVRKIRKCTAKKCKNARV